MDVTRLDLERSLKVLREAASDTQSGIHDPNSAAWRVNRELINFLGAGRAVLLQLAHPAVAYAIEQHSATRADLHGRFLRTFENVYAMLFGELDAALASARRVYKVHERIVGTVDEDIGAFAAGDPYLANDVSSLMWVYATLTDTALRIQDMTIGPLSSSFKERFYSESKAFAGLFGIPTTVLPEHYLDFKYYFNYMLSSGEIAVSRPGREMARYLMSAPHPSLAPVMAWYRAITAGLLPPRLRVAFDLPFGRAESVLFRTSIRACGRLHSLLPLALRYVPAYSEAMERVSGKEPYPMARWVARLSPMPSLSA